MMQPLFKPGQEVVCISDNWRVTHPYVGTPDKPTPKKNEIYIVESYWPNPINGKWFMTLKEFDADQLYNDRHFAEVMPQQQLVDELNEISISELVKSDLAQWLLFDKPI